MKTKNKFTALHRLIHWVMALAMFVLLITGFLRMNWMDKRKIAEIIGSKTDALTKDEMFSIAKAIREPMWDWHVIFAFVMIAAILIRFIYILKGGIRFPNPFNSKNSLKDRIHGFSYIYFYLIVAVAGFTGICLKYELFGDFHERIEETHKLGLYLFPVFILIHIAGVVIEEHTKKSAVVSKMIGGE